MNKATPQLIIAVAPTKSTSLRNFFSSAGGGVKEILEKPGQLRYAGWDLQTLDTARIVDGNAWQVKNGNRKTIRVLEDGTLIARVNADSSFLGWGKSETEFQAKPRLNPVALVEFTYNFVALYCRLIELFEEQPETITVRLEFSNLFIDGKPTYVIPYAVNTYAWLFDDEQYKINESNSGASFDLNLAEVLAKPRKAAYNILERMFLLFGVPNDKIPYTAEEAGSRIVDLNKIGVSN